MAWLIAAFAICAAPAMAQVIPAGIDLWFTADDGETEMNFANDPIPAGFFCRGSAAYVGGIVFEGDPIQSVPANVLGNTDTVIERLDDMDLSFGCDNTDIVVRVLSLISVDDLDITCGDGTTTSWTVMAHLDPTVTQPTTVLTACPSGCAGGLFDADLSLVARLTFDDDAGNHLELNGIAVTLSSDDGNWSEDIGNGGIDYPNSVQVDTDWDGVVDTTLPGTTNFHAGWSCDPVGGCGNPPCKVPVPHVAPTEDDKHSTTPPFPPPPPPCIREIPLDVQGLMAEEFAGIYAGMLDENGNVRPGWILELDPQALETVEVAIGNVAKVCPKRIDVFEPQEPIGHEPLGTR